MERTDQRTHHEAVGDLRYSIRYFHLQSRFFSKVEALFRLIYIVAGSSALGGFLAQKPELAGIAAFVSAIVTALDIVWSPGQSKYESAELMKRYTELDRKSRTMSIEEVDSEMMLLRQIGGPSIEALRVPAYNDSVIERGQASYVLATTLWQRFVAKLA